jgi:sRNA-binding carbon storage regulator CsrA
MFVLSRKSEESVIIDGFDSRKNALKVTVLDVAAGRVRLGFEVNSDALNPLEAISRGHEPEVFMD